MAQPPKASSQPRATRRRAPAVLGASPEAMAIEHAAMLAVWDKEADRFWVRSNLMLLVNGALLGAVAAANQPAITKIVFGVFGLFFSWSWLLLNNKSGYYVSRWRPVIEQYEKHMISTTCFPILPLTSVRPDEEAFQSHGVRGAVQVLLGRKTPRADAGTIMHYIVLGFVMSWILLTSLHITFAISEGRTCTPTPARDERNHTLGVPSPNATREPVDVDKSQPERPPRFLDPLCMLDIIKK